jgi:hypothetical protein
MPVNDNKPKTPEDIVNEVINGFLKGFSPTTGGTPTEPPVDSVKETHRLLKKAEDSTEEEAIKLLSIADRHIRIIEAALAYQN